MESCIANLSRFCISTVAVSISFSVSNSFLIIIIGLRKSASAPPRGEAREPGMQLSAFHQDRANRLPEQTQRRVYGGAARALRRGGGGGGGGIVKFFHWEGEPQRELDTATTTTSPRILQLIIRSTAFTTSVAPPSSRTADNTL